MTRTKGGLARLLLTRRFLLLLPVLCVLVSGGCTRRFWRDQADRQVWSLWNGFTTEAGQPNRENGIGVRPESRLYDPTNPDHPPMAPDDPLAHTRMHCVDGKRGWRKWHKYGEVAAVDDQHWRAFLPYDDEGTVVLDRHAAVQVALLNSRNYQRELEDLYLSALDVTFERFRFDAQFFFNNNTLFTTVGPNRPVGGGGSSSVLTTDTDFQVNKLYAGGGQLVVDFANSIVWQFAGADRNTNVSFLNFNFAQPLLRFAGRARVLERLTLAERNLIYNVRQMEQYRQGFYTQVVVGRNPGDGPATRGLGAGVGNPLPSFSGVGGFFGLLQSQVFIRNQEANVTTLRDSLARLQEEFDANRLKDRFQVELARQALYRGQSTLLASKANFQTSLDTFKLLLGLPPDVEMEVEDEMLQPFELIDPQVTQLTELAGKLSARAHQEERPVTDADLAAIVGDGGIQSQVEGHLVELEDDYARLLEAVPAREAQLETLLNRPEVVSGEVDRGAYSIEDLRLRVKDLRVDIDELKQAMSDTWSTFEKIRADLPTAEPTAIRDRLKRAYPDLSSQLLGLTLSKARARVDAVTWVPIDLTASDALETARVNRRDWANARAQLVDIWRLIEYTANALKAGLNVTLQGDLATTGDNPLNFRGSAGRMSAGLEFDAPLTRLIERNDYRAILIDYQRNRRAYMQFEDTISQNLRLILRTLELNQLNFEIRRTAVQVAIQQVDLARENLNRPPRVNETAEAYAAQRANIGRDLVSALGDLLDTQNDFLNVWVVYEVQRLNLDFEMGTMLLDDQGMWIDPGPVRTDPNAAVDDNLIGNQGPNEGDAQLRLPGDGAAGRRGEGVPVPQDPDNLPPPEAPVPGPVLKPAPVPDA